MGQYRRILVIASPSMQRTPALRRAMQLARQSVATLDLCIFDHHPGISAVGRTHPEVMELARAAYVAEREDWLAEAVVHMRGQGVRADSQFVWSARPEEQVVARVLEQGHELVIADVKLDPLSRTLRLTPLDRHLLRLCPAPLLLVQGEAGVRPRRVLAAVDPAEDHDASGTLNACVVREALALAIQCDASLHLAYAFAGLPPEAMSMTWSSGVMLDDAHQTLRGIRKTEFDAMARQHGVPLECRHFLSGDPALALPELAADSESDVIVVGAMHRTRFDRILLGSTAERILDAARGDVLVVKPEGFAGTVARHLGLPLRQASSADPQAAAIAP